MQPFIEEAVLQVSKWDFDIEELHVHKKCRTRGLLLWLKSMYGQADCELAGYLGRIHIWQVKKMFFFGYCCYGYSVFSFIISTIYTL